MTDQIPRPSPPPPLPTAMNGDNPGDDEEKHPAPLIRPISPAAVRRIVAGAAVTDLTSAVKELVDNAIDAGAGRVCVKLHDQGLEAIEVSDNGSGVPPTSRPLMAMKHATSKLRHFGDLYSEATGDDDPSDSDSAPAMACAPTLGFRGEALFCLANLSRSLEVSTKCSDGDVPEPLGEHFSFDTEGRLIAPSRQRLARPVGTTVTVRGLFESLPVRRADFCKRIKGQRKKLIKMMQGYAILCLGTQFTFSDVPAPNAKNKNSKGRSKAEVRIFATSESSKTLEARTASILGSKFLSGLTQITIDLSEAAAQESSSSAGTTATRDAGNTPWRVLGLVSHAPAAPCPTTARDLQFFSINGRPVDLPSVSRVLGDVWRAFDPAAEAGGAGRRRPACVWAFTLPRHAYDVNLSPDKREVMFTAEAAVAEAIREGLAALWAGQCEGKFKANEVQNRSNIGKGCCQSRCGLVIDGNRRQGVASVLVDKSTSGSKEKEKEGTASATLSGENDEITPKLRRSSNTASSSAGDSRLVTPPDLQNSPRDAMEQGSGGGVRSNTSEKEMLSTEATAGESNDVPCLEGLAKPANHGRQTPQIQRGWDQMQLPERARQQDRRGWEQKQLNYQRIEQKQHEQYFRPVAADNAEELTTNNAKPEAPAHQNQHSPSKPSNTSLDGVTVIVSKKSPAKTAAATNGLVSRMQSKRLKYQNQDVTSFLNSLASARANMVARGSPLKTNTLQKERNARMIVGRTAMSEKPGQPGPKALKPSSEENYEHCQGIVTNASNGDTASPPIKVKWNTFQGTQTVVAQSQSARLMMHKNRKRLRVSVKRKRDNGNGEAETSNLSLFKEDFRNMSIIGQFNLGFILARCRNNSLWILDQHACDERYNFERLIKETVIHEQKLISPLPIELSPSEEYCVLDNMAVFENNGFRFSYDEDKEPRHRLSLTALPHSGSGGDGKKAVQFGIEDVGALCAMLGADGSSSCEGYTAGFGMGLPAGGRIAGVNAVRRYAGSSQASNGNVGSTVVRLPKAVGMFANRACRGSIMIGTALSHKEQMGILTKLYKTDEPWSCAHGRPTMSHVEELTEILMEDDDAIAAHVAGPTLSISED